MLLILQKTNLEAFTFRAQAVGGWDYNVFKGDAASVGASLTKVDLLAPDCNTLGVGVHDEACHTLVASLGVGFGEHKKPIGHACVGDPPAWEQKKTS